MGVEHSMHPAFAALPPLHMDSSRRIARREISIPWFLASIFTGIAACILMGIALYAAFEGGQSPRLPFLSAYDFMHLTHKADTGQKGGRLRPTYAKQRLFQSSKEFEVPLRTTQGAFAAPHMQKLRILHMPLAETHAKNFKYPKFNALTIFTEQTDQGTFKTSAILRRNRIKKKPTHELGKIIPFNTSVMRFTALDGITNEEAQNALLDHASMFSDKTETFSIVYQGAPHSQKTHLAPAALLHRPEIKITQENVSLLLKPFADDDGEGYAEDIIPIRHQQTITSALAEANYEGQDARQLAAALTSALHQRELAAGSILRIGIETKKHGKSTLVRGSVYAQKHHIASVALNDTGQYVKSKEPERETVFETTLQGGIAVPHLLHNNLPRLYDAIYRSALAYKMPISMVPQILRILGTDRDLQSTISSEDSLDLLYTVGQATNKSEKPTLLYVGATFNGRQYKYYRFQSKSGAVEYYNRDAHSSKQFLLRKPVPSGIFSSPFGSRRHPILGYVRMHTGVDWAAPVGAPIVAAGDGIVTKVGYMNGYGKHTEIQHANGYMSSYSHQSRFARGIRPGVRVKQGQIIGYVGSTGLSTGAHCHFEIVVNGAKVDPMRVRMPDNHTLKGATLAAFKAQRNRIDELLLSQIGGQ